MRLLGILLVLWLLLCILILGDAFGQSKVAEVWAVDDGERVQRDENSHFMQTSTSNLVWRNSKVNIFGAKNEVISFQLILEAGSEDATQVGVYLDSLNHYPTDWVLKDSSWSGDLFNYVGRRIERFVAHYKQITARSATGGTYVGDALPMPDSLYTGWMPDAMIPAEADTTGTGAGKIGGMPFRIPANMNQCVWFDIYIPKNAPSGYYNGTIRIREAGVQTRTVPVQLIVHNITLSDTTHFPVALNLHSKNSTIGYRFGLASDSDTLYGMVKKFMRVAHRHRLNLTMNDCNYSRFTSSIASLMTGSYYTSANKYDGPGVSTGNRVWAIGPMEIALQRSATYQSTPTSPLFRSTTSWGLTSQANWVYEADRWEDWFVANAPHVLRYKYIMDEPGNFDWDMDGNYTYLNSADAQDSAVSNTAIRTMAGWLKGSSANARLC